MADVFDELFGAQEPAGFTPAMSAQSTFTPPQTQYAAPTPSAASFTGQVSEQVAVIAAKFGHKVMVNPARANAVRQAAFLNAVIAAQAQGEGISIPAGMNITAPTTRGRGLSAPGFKH